MKPDTVPRSHARIHPTVSITFPIYPATISPSNSSMRSPTLTPKPLNYDTKTQTPPPTINAQKFHNARTPAVKPTGVCAENPSFLSLRRRILLITQRIPSRIQDCGSPLPRKPSRCPRVSFGDVFPMARGLIMTAGARSSAWVPVVLRFGGMVWVADEWEVCAERVA